MKVDHKVSDRFKEISDIREDEILKSLSNMTTQQINNWVDNNVKNIEDVKKVLKKIIKFMKFFVKNYKI